jgi:hypothetical protein
MTIDKQLEAPLRVLLLDRPAAAVRCVGLARCGGSIANSPGSYAIGRGDAWHLALAAAADHRRRQYKPGVDVAQSTPAPCPHVARAVLTTTPSAPPDSTR